MHRLGLPHGAGGVAAARLAEVGDRPAAEPGRVDALPHRVDHAGDLAARRHRQVGERERAAGRAGADRRVEQVDPGRGDGDPDLPGAGLGIGDLLEAQDVGRAELVLADGVHGLRR